MYKHILLSSFLLVGLYNKAQAQFQHAYGTPLAEYGRGVQLTVDNGYIIAGRSTTNILGGNDGTLVKVTSSGAQQWSRVYGGPNYDQLNSVRQFPIPGGNFDYVSVGTSASFGGDNDVYLIRTNAGGIPVFARTFGANASDEGHCVQYIFDSITNQPGFAIVGETNSFPLAGGGVNLYVIITDIAGNMLRSVVIDSDNKDDKGTWIEQTQDGGFIVVGSTTNTCEGAAAATNEDIFVVRLGPGLGILWNNILGKTDSDEPDFANCVKENADGSFIITGTTSSFGAGNSDSYLLSLSALGAFNWMNTYGEANTEMGRTLLLATDSLGGYVVSGSTNSFAPTMNPNYDAFLYKTDVSGNLLWTRTYGKNGGDRGFEVTYSAVPGYALTGQVSLAMGNTDIYLVETDAFGNTTAPCEEKQPQIVMTQQPCITQDAQRTLVDTWQQVPAIHAVINYQAHRCEDEDGENDMGNLEDWGVKTKALASFTVSPNPTNTSHVKLSFNKTVKKGNLGIYNLYGELIKNVAIDNTAEVIIDISDLDKGIYMFRFTSIDDATEGSKFVNEVVKFKRE